MNYLDMILTLSCLSICLACVVLGRMLAERKGIDFRPHLIRAFDPATPARVTGEAIANIVTGIICYKYNLWLFLISGIVVHHMLYRYISQIKFELEFGDEINRQYWKYFGR